MFIPPASTGKMFIAHETWLPAANYALARNATFSTNLDTKRRVYLERHGCPWKSTVKVTFHFFYKQKLVMAFQRRWCAKLMYENFLKIRLILEMKFDLEIEIFMDKVVCGNSFTIFYVFSGSNYRRKPSKNLAYIKKNLTLNWRFSRSRVSVGIFLLFFSYSARETT